MNLQRHIPKTASRQKLFGRAFAFGVNRPESLAASSVWARRRVKLASGESLYNYFRDYDPSLGRCVQSDPIGLNAGVNTYAYVGGRPLSPIDPLGWQEICRKIIEDEWRRIAREEKIVDYRSLGSANDVLGALIDAFTTVNPGWSVAKKIPIYQSVQLNQLFLVRSEVCIDECGKETSRRKLSENPQDNYQEVFFNNRREGEPIWVGPGPAPNFGSRWGYGKRPR